MILIRTRISQSTILRDIEALRRSPRKPPVPNFSGQLFVLTFSYLIKTIQIRDRASQLQVWEQPLLDLARAISLYTVARETSSIRYCRHGSTFDVGEIGIIGEDGIQYFGLVRCRHGMRLDRAQSCPSPTPCSQRAVRCYRAQTLPSRSTRDWTSRTTTTRFTIDFRPARRELSLLLSLGQVSFLVCWFYRVHWISITNRVGSVRVKFFRTVDPSNRSRFKHNWSSRQV
jgi:hypothetical protein